MAGQDVSAVLARHHEHEAKFAQELGGCEGAEGGIGRQSGPLQRGSSSSVHWFTNVPVRRTGTRHFHALGHIGDIGNGLAKQDLTDGGAANIARTDDRDLHG
ncbi:unannotated protein [freshwater metagenome]|uniref:Unannotated protein n=1 Tax=freshwater metagenome TaxID=449393 RepID=A0A6J6WG93_9ZZZZ